MNNSILIWDLFLSIHVNIEWILQTIYILLQNNPIYCVKPCIYCTGNCFEQSKEKRNWNKSELRDTCMFGDRILNREICWIILLGKLCMHADHADSVVCYSPWRTGQ
jgi:hypothetical protein